MTQRGQALPEPVGAAVPTPITILLPGFPVVANDVTVNWLYVRDEFVLTDATFAIVAKAAPSGAGSGGSVICDILTSTNFGGSWTSIFPSGLANKLVLPTGTSHTSTTLTLAVPSFVADSLVRVDILQIDSGQTAADLAIFIIPPA